MKRAFPIILALAAVILPIFSCDDDPTRPPADTDSITVDEFPNMADIWWKYEVYDSLGNSYDTVMVACEEFIIMHRDKAAGIWVYHYETHEESLYVIKSHDTVSFYNDTLAVQPIMIYVFPLAVGRSWIWGDAPYDTVRVTQKSAISTPAGSFEKSFLVSREWDFVDNAGDIKTWIAANVGIIRERREWTSLATTTIELWELIDCQPPLLKPLKLAR